jgi:fucose 4-O-acetylase-like acetyltransferase
LASKLAGYLNARGEEREGRPLGQAEGDIATRSRDQGIDALRGLAIVLVVLGHSLVRAYPAGPLPGPGLVFEPTLGFVPAAVLTGPLLNAIYSFHMPLFAFLSGFVLFSSKRGYGWRLVSSRFLSLMVPYFAWLGVWWLLHGRHTLTGLLEAFGSAALRTDAPGALWFLYGLFMCVVVFALVRLVSGSGAWLAVSAVVVGALGLIPMPGNEHLFAVSDTAWLYPFFALGFLAAENRARVDGIRFALPVSVGFWLLSLALISPVLIPGPRWWQDSLIVGLAHVGVPAPDLVSKAVWAAARVLCAVAAISSVYFAYRRLPGWLLTKQAWLGRRSLSIYAIHGFFLLSIAAPGAPRVVTTFVLAMGLSVLLGLVLERFSLTRVIFLGMPSGKTGRSNGPS